jgi:hypothetical protein
MASPTAFGTLPTSGTDFLEPDMASPSTAFAQQQPDLPAIAYHKLDRLRELRAVIDTLRHELEPRDPLLAWIHERDSAENH